MEDIPKTNKQVLTPTTTTAATPSTSSAYTSGSPALDSYGQERVNQINKMYDAQRDSTLAQRQAAQNKVMSDAQAAYDKISPGYQEARNSAGATYEVQRHNNNLQAAARGLNTGAGSQMALAQSAAYQSNQAALEKAEQEALNEADRNMLTMRQQYEADISKTLSDNDSTRAAALLNEYGQQYDRTQNEAKQRAAYGDFSMYRTLYGDDVAAQMERTWLLQNPQLAYTLGKITAKDYFRMTGKRAPGSSSGGGGYSGGSSYGYGYGGNGGDNSTMTLTPEQLRDLRAQGATDAQIRDAAKQAGVSLPVSTVYNSYGYDLQNGPMSGALESLKPPVPDHGTHQTQ